MQTRCYLRIGTLEKNQGISDPIKPGFRVFEGGLIPDEREWEVFVHIEWPFIPGGLVCAIHPMLGTDCVNPSSFLSRFARSTEEMNTFVVRTVDVACPEKPDVTFFVVEFSGDALKAVLDGSIFCKEYRPQLSSCQFPVAG